MKNKVLILGTNSFIASHLNYEKYHNKINNEKDIQTVINLYKPDTIINCIAFTGIKNIDTCEDTNEHKLKTIYSNLTIPSIIADECLRQSVHVIQMGSGCIYYGKSPNVIKKKNYELTGDFPFVKKIEETDLGWKEEDFSNPLSLYSRTKAACDLTVGALPNVCTLRLRMPISTFYHPRNLLNKLLTFKKVLHELNSVSFLDDIVNGISWAIYHKKTGIYHVASPKPMYHKELIDEYLKYYPEKQYPEYVSKEEVAMIVKAPRSNCILNVDKIQNEGFEFNNQDRILKETIRKFVENERKSK
jgi:3,5-epimerase/4-reductase